MGAADRRVVVLDEIRSYSTISLTTEERDKVLRRLNKRLGYQVPDSIDSQTELWLLNLRTTLERQHSSVELDRREHTHLKGIVKTQMPSESLLERLKDAEAECHWCNQSARYQFHLDKADPVLTCYDCVGVLDSPHAYRLLQEIDPTIAPATEIIINDDVVFFPKNLKQTFLSDFTDTDPQPPSHPYLDQST